MYYEYSISYTSYICYSLKMQYQISFTTKALWGDIAGTTARIFAILQRHGDGDATMPCNFLETS